MTARPVLELRTGDVVRLRRPHPCGGTDWVIDRLGADIGLKCRTCGRRVLIERAVLERRLSGFVERGPAPTSDDAHVGYAGDAGHDGDGAGGDAADGQDDPGRVDA